MKPTDTNKVLSTFPPFKQTLLDWIGLETLQTHTCLIQDTRTMQQFKSVPV